MESVRRMEDGEDGEERLERLDRMKMMKRTKKITRQKTTKRIKVTKMMESLLQLPVHTPISGYGETRDPQSCHSSLLLF
jgi:hypothetical protein